MEYENTLKGIKDTFSETIDIATAPIENIVTVPQNLLMRQPAVRPVWESLVKLAFSPLTLSLKALKNISVGLVKDGFKSLGMIALNSPVLPFSIQDKINHKWEADKEQYALNPGDKFAENKKTELA